MKKKFTVGSRKVVISMTTMKRMSVIIPDHIVQKLQDLKKTDEFVNCSYAEIIRVLIARGLEMGDERKG